MPTATVATPVARKFLRLHLCPGIGPIRFANILREFGEIDSVLGASAEQLSRVPRVSRRLAEDTARHRHAVDVDRQIELAADTGARLLCLGDEEYPATLRLIDDPPACIFYKGELEPEDAVALAIVGSRHCSRYGMEQAERFGALAANAGLTVVSGMARGIDSAAHRGALFAEGRTIAVLGCGLCHLYPPESRDLAQQISEAGALVSELAMDVMPDAKNFPPRNRIIAGLSLGVLVVEAAHRSGALISARLANEYNREVFAIPGRIDSAHAAGCHDLLKMSAAKLVTGLEDILEELGEAGAALMPDPRPAAGTENRTNALLSLTEAEHSVLEALAADPMPVEGICEASELPPAQVASVLTGLQLKCVVRRVRGDLFERIRP